MITLNYIVCIALLVFGLVVGILLGAFITWEVGCCLLYAPGTHRYDQRVKKAYEEIATMVDGFALDMEDIDVDSITDTLTKEGVHLFISSRYKEMSNEK